MGWHLWSYGKDVVLLGREQAERSSFGFLGLFLPAVR